MSWLNPAERQHVRARLREVARGVRLIFFTQESACPCCREAQMILEDLAGLSDALHLEVRDFLADAEEAKRCRVDKIPATVIEPDSRSSYAAGIRYYGAPAGYEFSSLVDDVLMVGRGDSGLAEQSRIVLRDLYVPVHLQVFVTPTCPDCPKMIRLAHQLAWESPWIQADAVQAIEFPHLTVRYGVMGVPRTVINDELDVEGAVPEATLVAKVLEAGRPGRRRVVGAREPRERDVWR